MKNLRIALSERKMSTKEFADFLGICESSAKNKLSEKTEFTYSEFKKITKYLFPQYNSDYLFAEDESA